MNLSSPYSVAPQHHGRAGHRLRNFCLEHSGRYSIPWIAVGLFLLLWLAPVVYGAPPLFENHAPAVSNLSADMLTKIGALGSDRVAFDLNGDDSIDRSDLSLFSEQFGAQVASKRVAVDPEYPTLPAAAVTLVTHSQKTIIDVELQIDQVEEVIGYGVTLRYDADGVRFVGLVDTAQTLLGVGGSRISLVREERPGLLQMGEYQGSSRGDVVEKKRLACLRFAVDSVGREATFGLEKGLLIQEDGTILRVSGRPTVRLIPQTYALGAAYPNPFNPSTTIPVSVPTGIRKNVELQIYNALGQQVRDLSPEGLGAGYHQLSWDGRDAAGHRVASGVYLVQLRAGAWAQTQKLTLLR